jgi:hypothetical protein
VKEVGGPGRKGSGGRTEVKEKNDGREGRMEVKEGSGGRKVAKKG